MTSIKYFLLLFVLFATFNVGYNLKCYSCIMSKNCVPRVKTCANNFFFNNAACITGKFKLFGVDYTYKGCQYLMKKKNYFQFLHDENFGALYRTCKEDLCN